MMVEEHSKLSEVVDFRNIGRNKQHHQESIEELSSRNDLRMYGYRTFPGLYFIPNYLSTQQQYEWTKQSIQSFSSAPYNNLSNLYSQQKRECPVPSWTDAVERGDFSAFRQLTWSNVGIQYDWTERKYNLERITAPIPRSMTDLCSECNELLTDIQSESHGIDTFDDEQKEGDSDGLLRDEHGLAFSMEMVPQTAIINFFAVNTKRPMGGHRDAAELINAPLISVSLGNDAIFLISDHDQKEPLALWIRSGDVLIMAGKARFALHCVARVVPNTCCPLLLSHFDGEIDRTEDQNEQRELSLMKQYIMESRINFNIRQVIEVDKLPSSQPQDSEPKTTVFHEVHSF